MASSSRAKIKDGRGSAMNKIKRIRRKQWIKAFKLMGAMNNTDLLNLFISRLSLKALIFLLHKEGAQP